MTQDPAGMSTGGPSRASWDFADGFVGEDPVLLTARSRAAVLGCPCPAPGAGAVLRMLATAVDARAVVEVGTGVGVTGTWLLRGMRTDAVLTTVDADAEHHQVARETFGAAGFGGRVRQITGRALEVLPRLTDGVYDLVVVGGEVLDYQACLSESLRLLRPGGIVAFLSVLHEDRLADAAVRDAETIALRELVSAVHDDERLVPSLLPVSDGLLVAVLRPDRD